MSFAQRILAQAPVLAANQPFAKVMAWPLTASSKVTAADEGAVKAYLESLGFNIVKPLAVKMPFPGKFTFQFSGPAPKKMPAELVPVVRNSAMSIYAKEEGGYLFLTKKGVLQIADTTKVARFCDLYDLYKLLKGWNTKIKNVGISYEPNRLVFQASLAGGKELLEKIKGFPETDRGGNLGGDHGYPWGSVDFVHPKLGKMRISFSNREGTLLTVLNVK